MGAYGPRSGRDAPSDRGVVPIAPVLEHYGVDLRGGSRFGEQVTLCPVHGERRPSLSVNTEKGVAFCFACGFKGTAVHLVMAMESCDKAEALKRLEPILRNAGVEMKQSVRSRYQRPGEGRTAAPGRIYVPPGRR